MWGICNSLQRKRWYQVATASRRLACFSTDRRNWTDKNASLTSRRERMWSHMTPNDSSGSAFSVSRRISISLDICISRLFSLGEEYSPQLPTIFWQDCLVLKNRKRSRMLVALTLWVDRLRVSVRDGTSANSSGCCCMNSMLPFDQPAKRIDKPTIFRG